MDAGLSTLMGLAWAALAVAAVVFAVKQVWGCVKFLVGLLVLAAVAMLLYQVQ